MKTFLSTLVLAIMAHSVSANATTSPIGRYLVVTLPQTLSMVLYRAAVVGELPPTVKVSSGKTSGIRYIDYCQSGEESNAPCSSLDHDGGSRWMRCYFFRSGPTCSIRILEANYIYIVPDAKDNASVVTFDQSKSRFFFEFLMTRKYSKQHKEGDTVTISDDLIGTACLLNADNLLMSCKIPVVHEDTLNMYRRKK